MQNDMTLSQLIDLRLQCLLLAREIEVECFDCQVDLANAYFEWCTMGVVKIEEMKINPEEN